MRGSGSKLGMAGIMEKKSNKNRVTTMQQKFQAVMLNSIQIKIDNVEESNIQILCKNKSRNWNKIIRLARTF